MRTFILTTFLLLSLSAFAESVVRLTGKIKNAEQQKISISFYPNWVEKAKELEVPIKSDGSFYVEFPVASLAYVDLNFGSEGLLGLMLEPNDMINFETDLKNFNHSTLIWGAGSSKWVYAWQHRNKYEITKDWDFELNKLRKLAKEPYFKMVDWIVKSQLELLDKFRDSSFNRFLLRTTSGYIFQK